MIRESSRGFEIVRDRAVVSELGRRPGPSNPVFNCLAAIIHLLAPQGRVGVLGFGLGGLLGPLRFINEKATVEAVDLFDPGIALFRGVAGDWAGKTEITSGDAVEWLTQRNAGFDLILDDLSISEAGEELKPRMSWSTLPEIIQRKLRPGGVAVINMVRPSGITWKGAFEQIRSVFPQGKQILFHTFENKILVFGDSFSPREFSIHLKQSLQRIGSDPGEKISVRKAW